MTGAGRGRSSALALLLLGAGVLACRESVPDRQHATSRPPPVLSLGDDLLRVQPAAVAFVDGGKTLVAGSERRTQYLDVETGRVLREGPPATRLLVTPDGKWLLAAVSDFEPGPESAVRSALSLRDPTTGAEVRSIPFPGYPPDRARWSKDGKSLYLRVSSLDSGRELEVPLSDVLAGRITTSPWWWRDGGRDPLEGFALPLEPVLPTEDPTGRTQQRAEVLATAWSPSGARVAVELQRGGVLIFDRDPQHPRRFDWSGTGGSGPGELSFVGEERLVLASRDTGIRMFDLATGALVRALPSRAHDRVTISPDGELIATWCSSTGVQLWDTATGRERLPHTGHRGGVSAIAFSPDGVNLVTGAEDGTVRAWDTRTGGQRRVLEIGSPIAGLALDDTGRVALNGYQRVEVWRLADGTRIFRSAPAGGSNSNEAISFAQDGSAVEYHSYGSPVYRWDLSRNATVSLDDPALDRLRDLSPLHREALSADREKVLVAERGAAVLRELPSGKELGRFATDSLESLAIARDGRAFAVGERGGRITWIEGSRRRELQPWGDVAVTALAFSPDGQALACGSDEGHTVLWRPDPATIVAEPDRAPAKAVVAKRNGAGG
jgi:WD40 repeat protein